MSSRRYSLNFGHVCSCRGNNSPGIFILVRKRYLSPALLKIIFFPLSQHFVLRLLSWPFCFNSFLFCIYFTISQFSFPFSLSLSPSFFFPLSSLFFYIFPVFHFTIFFPQMILATSNAKNAKA